MADLRKVKASSHSTDNLRGAAVRSSPVHIDRTHSLPNITDGHVDEKKAESEYRILHQKGSLQEKGEKLEEALESYQMALYYELQLRGDVHIEVAKTHRVIGRVLRKLNKPTESVESVERALEICRTVDHVDADVLWRTHDELAQSYSPIDVDKEIEHYESAIRILKMSTDIPPERLAYMHNNVGIAYCKKKKFQPSEEHLLTAKTMMSQLLTDQVETAKVHKSLGDLYSDMGDNDRAMLEFTECLNIYQRSPKKGLGHILWIPVYKSVANIHEKRGEPSSADAHRDVARILQQQADSGEREKQNTLAGRGVQITHVTADAQTKVEEAKQCLAQDDHHGCVKHYEEARNLLQTLPPDVQGVEQIMHQMSMVHNNLGNAYRSVSRWSDARREMKKALELRRFLYANEPCDQTATSLFNLGYIYTHIPGVQNVIEAINHHKEALGMYMVLGGPQKHLKWIVGLYRSLASNYYSVGEVNESIKCYEQAKTVINEYGGDLMQLQAICNNVGNSYKTNRDYVKAEESFKMALELAQVLSDSQPDNAVLANDIATSENNIGCLYQEIEEFEKAITHHTNSLRIREQISEQYVEAVTDIPSTLHNLANAHYSAGAYNDAIDYYKREEKARRNLGEDPKEVLVSLSKLYESMGRPDDASRVLGAD